MSSIYRVNPSVAIEDFGERALALNCIDLRLVELNITAKDLAARLNGTTNLHQVAVTMARDYGRPLEMVIEDIQASVTQMTTLGIVERVSPTPQNET